MLTARIEKIRHNYVNAKPQISCERAALWTESYKTSEGKPACIRSAQAFYDCCAGLGGGIFLRGSSSSGPSANTASAVS